MNFNRMLKSPFYFYQRKDFVMEQDYVKAIMDSQKEIKQELNDLKAMVSDLITALDQQTIRTTTFESVKNMENELSFAVACMCLHYDKIVTDCGFLSIDNPKYLLFERFDELIEEYYLPIAMKHNADLKINTVDYIYNRDDTEKMYFDLTDEIKMHYEYLDLPTEQDCVDLLEEYFSDYQLHSKESNSVKAMALQDDNNVYDPFELDKLEEEEFDAMQYLDLEIAE